MPFEGYYHRNLSQEWEYWREHYRRKGCGGWKLLKLTHRKMRKLYGVG